MESALMTGGILLRINARFLSLAALIFAAALLRLVPHPANFTPIAAIALFGASRFEGRWTAVLAPFAALLLSDLILGFHSQMPAVYFAFFLVVVLGFVFVRDTRSVPAIAGTSLLGSMVFFFVTNFSVWAQIEMYPKTAEGLTACFIAALPFLRNSIAGDLMFTGVLFGAWFALEKWAPKLTSENLESKVN
jgi:hypothetical protein